MHFITFTEELRMQITRKPLVPIKICIKIVLDRIGALWMGACSSIANIKNGKQGEKTSFFIYTVLVDYFDIISWMSATKFWNYIKIYYRIGFYKKPFLDCLSGFLNFWLLTLKKYSLSLLRGKTYLRSNREEKKLLCIFCRFQKHKVGLSKKRRQKMHGPKSVLLIFHKYMFGQHIGAFFPSPSLCFWRQP